MQEATYCVHCIKNGRSYCILQVYYVVHVHMYISECVCYDYSLHFTATVQYEDFTFVPEQLIFDSNDTSRTVSISATVDSNVEGNEMFTISLSSDAPNLAIQPAIATVTITDLTSELQRYICTVYMYIHVCTMFYITNHRHPHSSVYP